MGMGEGGDSMDQATQDEEGMGCEGAPSVASEGVGEEGGGGGGPPTLGGGGGGGPWPSAHTHTPCRWIKKSQFSVESLDF
jgi:hypothetical protein